MTDDTMRRSASIAGGIFAVTFFIGLLLVGDQAGAFADSESAYTDIFSDSSHRIQDLAGSLLLVVSAVAFGTFGLQLAGSGDVTRPASTLARVGGGLASVSILIAGAAFLTVPASLLVGDFFGDPGLVTAQPVLPHFGFILLAVGTTIPAGALMVASTRLGSFPTWLKWVTFASAVLLVLTGSSVITVLILPIWVAVVTVSMRRSSFGP